MNFPWPIIQYMQDFFQLNFLFSGLEVSSTVLIITRIIVFSLTLGFASWFLFKIIIKILECFQEFIKGVAPIPKSLFLLIFLAVPLSAESIGAKWIGYIMLILLLIALAGIAVLLIVVWKYGVDQAMRLINYVKGQAPVEHAEPAIQDPSGA